MSLRARLVVAYLAVVLVLGVALVGVARTQRDHLVGQIDRQLGAARPFLQPFPDVVPIDEVDRVEPKPPPALMPLTSSMMASSPLASPPENTTSGRGGS